MLAVSLVLVLGAQPGAQEKPPQLIPKASELLDDVDDTKGAKLPPGAPQPGEVIGEYELVRPLGPPTRAQGRLPNGVACGYHFPAVVQLVAPKAGAPRPPSVKGTIGVLCQPVSVKKKSRASRNVLGAAAFAAAVVASSQRPGAKFPLTGAGAPDKVGDMSLPARAVRPTYVLTFDEVKAPSTKKAPPKRRLKRKPKK